jgi:hypothetical protein
MGCGACWNETYREKGDVVRGGWADVARQLPVSSSVWIAAMPFSPKRHSAEWIVSEFAVIQEQSGNHVRQADFPLMIGLSREALI